MRHAARAHAGARQARRRARAARAAAPARRAAPDRARLGDARRCRRPTARARSSSRSTCTRTRRSSSTATGATERVALTPDRAVGDVTRELLARGRARWPAPVEIDPTPQEVSWTRRRSTRTTSTRRYDARAGRDATSPPRRAPRSCSPPSARPTAGARRRSTPGGARSTSPSTCSPAGPPTPPSTTSSCATRWTPRRSPSAGGRATRATASAAFYAYAHPAPEGFAGATLEPGAARWDAELGEYVLDWDDVRRQPRPARRRARLRALGLRITPARSASGTRRSPPAPRARRRRSSETPILAPWPRTSIRRRRSTGPRRR